MAGPLGALLENSCCIAWLNGACDTPNQPRARARVPCASANKPRYLVDKLLRRRAENSESLQPERPEVVPRSACGVLGFLGSFCLCGTRAVFDDIRPKACRGACVDDVVSNASMVLPSGQRVLSWWRPGSSKTATQSADSSAARTHSLTLKLRAKRHTSPRQVRAWSLSTFSSPPQRHTGGAATGPKMWPDRYAEGVVRIPHSIAEIRGRSVKGAGISVATAIQRAMSTGKVAPTLFAQHGGQSNRTTHSAYRSCLPAKCLCLRFPVTHPTQLQMRNPEHSRKAYQTAAGSRSLSYETRAVRGPYKSK